MTNTPGRREHDLPGFYVLPTAEYLTTATAWAHRVAPPQYEPIRAAQMTGDG